MEKFTKVAVGKAPTGLKRKDVEGTRPGTGREEHLPQRKGGEKKEDTGNSYFDSQVNLTAELPGDS